jgi:hypothetical protein
MFKINRMWKCECDVICFNSILCVFVEIMQHPKLGAVRQFCVFIAFMLGMLAAVYTVKCTRVG